jgi:hypothetical protein
LSERVECLQQKLSFGSGTPYVGAIQKIDRRDESRRDQVIDEE